jgi:homogentisate 1,2-dioxygenase
MPTYQRRGQVPPKRHTVFRKPDGELYAEELVSTEGFSAIYSLVYHEYPPTRVLAVDEPQLLMPEVVVDNNMQHRSFQGFQVEPEDDFVKSRKVMLLNDDVQIALAAPRKSMDKYFYKNALADEMIFIHQGKGVLHSLYGDLPFVEGDHLVIPRGTVFQLTFENEKNRLLILESFHSLKFPRRYVNQSGQLLEHAPLHERDIKTPDFVGHHNEEGDFLIKIKRKDQLFAYHYANHPFDAVGWDGYLYPYSFSIYEFEPITGRIHQPPPVHQTFETDAFVTCAFVPRMYDYHPQAIPAPYHHSNVDSDEVLYYVDGDFMSRNNIERGQITLHPMGIPHGPHPGAAERSIGKKQTEEYAVMIDTFKPLKITREALNISVDEYFKSWMDSQ